MEGFSNGGTVQLTQSLRLYFGTDLLGPTVEGKSCVKSLVGFASLNSSLNIKVHKNSKGMTVLFHNFIQLF